MRVKKKFLEDRGTWIVLVFFFFLALFTASNPTAFVFDEVHYVPSFKELIQFKTNINFEHPPLAKWILGVSWLLYKNIPGFSYLHELFYFRMICFLFGLWTLHSLSHILKSLSWNEWPRTLALLLTATNFLWFVQSRTVMLDIFPVALSLYGVRLLFANKENLWGWAFLGASVACKWSIAPWVFVSLFLFKPYKKNLLKKISSMTIAYVIPFLLLGFCENTQYGTQWNIIQMHQAMVTGMSSISEATHPYQAPWWKWALLIRPMWYHFETIDGKEQSLWAGGNPLVFWGGLLCVLFFTAKYFYKKFKNENKSSEFVLLLFYWSAVLFWVFIPRKIKLMYYYLPSSLFLGPMIVLAIEKIQKRKIKVLVGILLGVLSSSLFYYFLPILTAKPVQPGTFTKYLLFQSWL